MANRAASPYGLAALVFLPLALVAAAVMSLLYHTQTATSWAVTQAGEKEIVKLGRQAIAAELHAIVSDLLYLSDQQALRQWLGSGDAAARRQVAAEYLAFATRKRAYDQVRLLDADGREVVRVDRSAGKLGVVPDDRLQDKKDRYYVDEILERERGQVYVSPFDLNVEHGVVERPVKPVIRFGTPVFDAEGEKRGLLVLNYLGQRLLDRVAAVAVGEPGHVWLVNTDGHWLLGPRAEDEWGFMYPNRQTRTFEKAHPQAWEKIRDGANSAQFVAAGDLFTYVGMFPGAGRPESVPDENDTAGVTTAPSWFLIAHVPAAKLAAQTASLARNLSLATAVLMLLLAAAAWVVARHWLARRTTERAIRQSEARFRSLLESAPDSVVIADGDGRIVFANGQTETLFGYSRDRLIGQEVEVLMPARFRGRHPGHRAGYLANPHRRPMGANLDLYGARSDGTEFPAEISLSPIQSDQGTMVFCDIRDVTEQRQAERRIQELNERLRRENATLEALNKELEAFSYSVSHDLRAPLRAIDGFSQALLEDHAEGLDEAGRDCLARVRGAAQRMGLLIDDLLKLSRVTRAGLTVREVDLSALAGAIARDLQRSDPRRPAEITIAPELRGRGDARLLRIALENLLNNAWKFTAGRAPARIEFGRTNHGGQPSYFVRDNGVGFDMAYAGKLFGAFQRLHDARAFPGTGVGLATVQRIVQKHGGRVWAEAETDKGAAFYFTL